MKITKYLIGGLAALALAGCKDKMRELNTSVSTVGEADQRFAFFNAMQNFDYGRGNAINSFASEGQIFQYFVSYTGASEGTYSTVGRYSAPGQIGNYYSSLYNIGYKMQLIQNYIDDNLAEDERDTYQNLRAVAGIVKVLDAFRVFQNYGAAVYTQAFKAITEGITLPAYDLYSNQIYELLDDELAGYIGVLEQKLENQVPLQTYDPVYGWVVNKEMGAPSAASDYAAQWNRWAKFGNSYRLYMAWIMKAVDPGRFNEVLAQTSGKWFESAADGAYSYINGPGSNQDAVYNSNDVSAVSVTYSVTDNFISYLKELKDPRLPLLARANSLYAANPAIQWIQAYFPDSLRERQVYDSETKEWNLQSWNGILDFGSDPLLAYQGQTPNPAYASQGMLPGKFWNQRSLTLRFYHPDYKPGANNKEYNDKLGPWTVTNDGSIIPVSEAFPASFTIWNPDTSFTINVASRPQGRYFCSCGGRSFDDATNNAGNGYDGSVANWSKIYFRHPIYTYPEFCYMMAYLTLDGANTGQPAATWYEKGLEAALNELQADAVRYGVQVATERGGATDVNAAKVSILVNPTVEGINSDGVYAMDEAEIGAYVTAQALANATDQKEAVVGQMWIYAYNQPIKMWDWWRVTGYPKIKTVQSPADRPEGLYWVQPERSSGTEADLLQFPRRGALPQPKAANNENYNAVRDELMKQPLYGATYGATTGRIYWDTQGL